MNELVLATRYAVRPVFHSFVKIAVPTAMVRAMTTTWGYRIEMGPECYVVLHNKGSKMTMRLLEHTYPDLEPSTDGKVSFCLDLNFATAADHRLFARMVNEGLPEEYRVPVGVAASIHSTNTTHRILLEENVDPDDLGIPYLLRDDDSVDFVRRQVILAVRVTNRAAECVARVCASVVRRVRAANLIKSRFREVRYDPRYRLCVKLHTEQFRLMMVDPL
jgi:hypothetical protein